MSKIEKAIKQAILKSGKTNYRISQETGLTQAMLSRVMSGKRGLGLGSAEILAKALNLEIIVRPRKSTGRTKKKVID